MMKVNPADLRFTQDSIACHFQPPHEHVSITEALKKIQTGQMSPADFPKLRVISHNGCLWSVDNRRLWVFRKAKCSQITVRMWTKKHHRFEALKILQSTYVRYSKAEFLPRVRMSQNVSPTLIGAQSYPQPRVAEVTSRSHLEKARGSQNVFPLSTVASTNVHWGLEGAMRGFKRPTLHPCGPLLPNSLMVTKEGFVTTGLRTDSSNRKSRMEPFPSSSSGSSGGRQDSAVARTQPRRKPNVDIFCSFRHCTGTQERQSHLQENASEHTPLLPGWTNDYEGGWTNNYEGRRTNSQFGWVRKVRNVIFGCFGCG